MGKLLDDSELEYFDSIASELNALAGDDINYYAMNRAKYKIDPLYGEPIQRQTLGPFRVSAWFQWPNLEPEAGEQGFGYNFDCLCVISRIDLDEQEAPYPSEADVIEAWRTPYHDAKSLGKGMFFDVIKVNNDGHVNDTASFVQFKLYLKRRTEFGAERRITPP
jgi:hypothetical protein